MRRSCWTNAYRRHRYRLGLAAALVCACANSATIPEAYPRAQAATHALQLGVAIEHGLHPLTLAVPALFGKHAEIAWERQFGG